ncbi:hypothetical protein O6H91_01G033400 [Diphasiastrum complanatum]|uniref:Uncharacterized protein n=1 Tax=Diphasiastrum complanatum TaxID=34168 RepID=A0ACC2EPQ3_DIPCM|nr:hypothetical protein O6H91_01G033400 [Diphasiastrum complanatum]
MGLFVLLFGLILCCVGHASAGDDLRVGFYTESCPKAEFVAREALRMLLVEDPTAAAALLRLSFHDCDVKGCDASILLDSTYAFRSELESNKNFGIRRTEFIDHIKHVLEILCPQTVSCADVVALAARDAIHLSGGPDIQIPTGRRDSLTAYFDEADANLRPATASVDSVLQDFSPKGFSMQEAVALLGSHTLGVGHCLSISDRLHPQTDPSMEPFFAAVLKVLCPNYFMNSSNIIVIPNDATSLLFDNRYFIDAKAGLGLFRVDSNFALDPRTAGFVEEFAQDKEAFFEIFSGAFVKLTKLNVLTGDMGQVRKNCHTVN